VFGLVQDIQSLVERVAKYGELGDPVGQGLTIARAALGLMRARGTNVQDAIAPLAKVVSIVHFAVNVAGGTATAGTGGAAAPVAVTASGVVALINLITEATTKAVDLCMLALDGIDGYLGIIELGNAACRAQQAESMGQFDHAAEFRSIMRGVAIDSFFSRMKYALDAGMFLFGLGEFPIKTLGGLPLGLLIQPGVDALGANIEGAGALAELLNDTVGDELLGGLDVQMPFGGGLKYADSLRSPVPLVAPPLLHTGDAALDGARAQTAAESVAAHQAAHAAKPLWHQPLIDAIAATPSFTMATAPDMLRPTWYLEQIARALRHGVTGMSATTIDTAGALIDQLGANLQPAFDLAVIGINGFIAMNLPKLQTMATDVNSELQKTRVELSQARQLVGRLQQMTGIARGAAVTARGVALGFRDQLLAVIDGAKLELPDVPGLDGVEGMWNQTIADLRARVTSFSTAIIADVEAQIVGIIAALEARLAALQVAIAAGGTVETELQTIYSEMLAMVDSATKELVKWQPVIPRLDVTGAGTWLRNLAAQWRAGIEIERGQRPDPWRTMIVPVVIQYVAAWKAAHGLDLERAFYPRMPASELAACAQVFQRGMRATQAMSPGAGSVARASLQAAYARVTEAAAGQGVDALHALWQREEVLVMLVRGVEAAAPSALPPAAEAGDLLEEREPEGGERP